MSTFTMRKINLFCIILSAVTILTLGSKSYGPYALRITSLSVCHAPKAKDCTDLQTRISGPSKIAANMTVLNTCVPSKVKIMLWSNGKELSKMHISNLCEHIFLRQVFEKLYNITKRCEITKGRYTHDIDIGQYIRNYFGDSFFYGTLSIKATIYSDKCNFSCSTLGLDLTPKK